MGLFERRMQKLRIIIGGVFEHGVWRRKMNNELAELYGELSILTLAKAARIRCHIIKKAGVMPTIRSTAKSIR